MWPQTATRYVISVTYDDGPVYYYDGAPLPPPGQCPDSALGTCINHTFAGVAGGREHHSARVPLLGYGLAGGTGENQVTAGPADRGQHSGGGAVRDQGEPGPADARDHLHNPAEAVLRPPGSRLAHAHLPAGRDGVPISTARTSATTWGSGSAPLAIGNQGGIGYSWAASGQNVPLGGTGDKPYSGQEWTFQAIGVADPQSELKFSGWRDHDRTLASASAPTCWIRQVLRSHPARP